MGVTPPTTVYLLYGVNDDLLYVGITGNLKSRFQAHALDKEWWPEVDRAEYHHLPTRSMAQRAEAGLIRDLAPRYNSSLNRARRCQVCDIDRAVIKGRCHACDRYFNRHGVERPVELAQRAIQRRVKREMLRAPDGRTILRRLTG